jgi:DNA ligase D-like protein (predicted 3'-phosphoesterase)
LGRTEAGVKRLAVQVEDHDSTFGEFEGNIPQSQYGAGAVRIWDKVEYAEFRRKTEQIEFTLSGKHLHRPFRLLRFKQAKPRDWLLFKLEVAK